MQYHKVLDLLGREGIKSYHVHSLYYDSDDYLSYYQNLDGEYKRSKYRLRYYDQDDQNCFWEVKQKVGNRVFKDRLKIGPKNMNLDSSRDLEFRKPPYQISPKLQISYKRIVLKDDINERITLDSDIRFKFLSLDNSSEFTLENKILEIKIPQNMTSETQQVIKKLALELGNFSKYAVCFDYILKR